MVKIKGENVFPNEVDEIIFARPQIAEYQARVTIGDAGRDVAEIRLAFAAPGPPDRDLIERLRQELKARTNITFELRTVRAEELPQWTTPDVKPRRWVDQRQADLAASATP
jgi:phenylacetate-coenzyme A ligase PaaK-like adenylate-forming protein